MTGEATLAREDDEEGDGDAGPHEEVDPRGGDDVVLGEGGAEVRGADVVELEGDDLAVADGLRHVDVLGHLRHAEEGSGGGGGDLADASGGNNTTEHFVIFLFILISGEKKNQKRH